jgi:ubiquinone/menaquinone biosynthesis C-methylase UbiE
MLNRFVKHYNEELSYQIFGDFSKNNKPLTLEVGCGDGRKTALFSKLASNIIGLDISAEKLEEARQKGLDVILADGHFLPFADNCFGAIITSHNIEHLTRPLQASQEMYRTLKDNSFVLLITPNRGRIHTRIGLGLLSMRTRSNDRYPLNPLHVFEYDEKNLLYIIRNFSKVQIIPLFIGFKFAGSNIELKLPSIFKRYCDQWIAIAIK